MRIFLYLTYFCLNDSQERLTYASPQSEILVALRDRTVPQRMLEDLYANGTPFYDRCLIVEVHNYRNNFDGVTPRVNRAAAPAEEASSLKEAENMRVDKPDSTPVLLSLRLPKITTVVLFPPDKNSADQSAAGMFDTRKVAIFQPSLDIERFHSSAIIGHDSTYDKDSWNPYRKLEHPDGPPDAPTPNHVTDASSSALNKSDPFTGLGSDRGIATKKSQYKTLDSSGYTAPTSSTPHSSATSRQGSFARTSFGSTLETTEVEEPQTTTQIPRPRRLSESDFRRYGSGAPRRRGVVEPDYYPQLLPHSDDLQVAPFSSLPQEYAPTTAHNEFNRQETEPLTYSLETPWSISNLRSDRTDQDVLTYRELTFTEPRYEQVSERTTSQQLGVADSDGESDRGSFDSQVDSIFSVASLASTASAFSTASGYNAVQIETATKELLQIFLEDALLASLYKSAIQRVDIGSERLQRNIRRMLKAFAQALRVEANKELEVLAARLVSMKASYVSQCIIERYEVKSPGYSVPDPKSWRQTKDDSSDEDENVDDDIQKDLIDEDLIEDLSAFRGFLTGGNAFMIFRKRLEAFALPRAPETHPAAASKEFMDDQVLSTNTQDQLPKQIQEETSHTGPHWMLLRKPRGRLAALLIAAGCLEPPLNPGWVRLRWQCVSATDHPPGTMTKKTSTD
ncbi:uncharacterized protein EKO05_0004432 [Ascochyta rabiei]|uniref:uncharacterized protein n=1 Tax=Didymella rabiei TaxID=5454 RepID=UPI0021FDBA3C|nr:uncharacterized protein EKO05_0004432 [Ascochyta rabiei]UPX13937.1 hypothetical protein EKO05_0004432 [Ascochyta rabiei]